MPVRILIRAYLRSSAANSIMTIAVGGADLALMASY